VALKAIQTPTAIALILCIVGATSANSPLDITSQTTVQAGVIIFLVVVVVLIPLVAGGFAGHRRTGRGEPPLLRALAVALPLLVVRITYSMLTCFGHYAVFTPGNQAADAVVAQTIMSTVMEMAVTATYLWAGLRLKDAMPDPSQSGAHGDGDVEGGGGGGGGGHGRRRQGGGGGRQLRERMQRGDFAGGKLGLLTLASAAVTALREETRGSDSKPSRELDERAGMRHGQHDAYAPR
jgi:uncharacterized membrane protein YgcG